MPPRPFRCRRLSPGPTGYGHPEFQLDTRCQLSFLGAGTQGPEPVNGIGSDYNCFGCLTPAQKGATSPDILTSDTPFMPKYKTWAHTFALNWKQTITEWLSATVDVGF